MDSGPTGAVGVHRVGSAEGDRGDGSVEAFPLVSGQSTIAVEPDLAGGGDLALLRPGGGGGGLSFDGKTVGTAQAVVGASRIGQHGVSAASRADHRRQADHRAGH